jgi:hypothetical protein
MMAMLRSLSITKRIQKNKEKGAIIADMRDRCRILDMPAAAQHNGALGGDHS